MGVARIGIVGDMKKSVYDADDDGVVDVAASVNGSQADAIVANTNARHTHSNLSVLDATTASFTTELKDKLDGIEAGAEVNNLSDSYASALTSGGETSLHYHASDRLRANHTGTQLASTISDFDTAVSDNADVSANTAYRFVGHIPLSEKGAASGVAPLDASGKINSSYLPSIALSEVHTVASEAEQLALTAQEGDVAIRTDLNKSYVHNGGTAGDMTDWSELLTPTDSVLSVNGYTGAVVLDYNDVGAAAASHTHDHGSLSGLGDDDHPQYIMADGSRAFTGPILAADGSFSAPGISFANETNTGWFRFGTNYVALVVGGSFVMTTTPSSVDFTQNIKVKNVTPSSNNAYDLGSSSLLFRDAYIYGNLSDGTNNVSVAEAKTAYDHTSLTNNPHNVTSSQLGLGSTDDVTFNSVTVGNDTIIKGEEKSLTVNLDPTQYAAGDVVALDPKLSDAITVTGVYVTHGNTPAVELDADLLYADAIIGLANETLITALDTTSGVYENTALSVAVAAGKALYIKFGADPDSTETLLVIKVYFRYS